MAARRAAAAAAVGGLALLARAEDHVSSPEAMQVLLDEMQGKFVRLKEARFEGLAKLRAEEAAQEAVLQDKLEALESRREKRRRRLQVNETEAQAFATQASALTATLEDLSAANSSTWMILCGAMVMFMQAGFAMVEAGVCRARNVQNILMKNLVDVCVGTMCWWAIGWTLAYGVGNGPNNAFANNENLFGSGFVKTDADSNHTPSDNIQSWFFQWAFCSAAATIVSGGVAERIQFPGYLVFTILMTSFIYPIVAHWTWGGGWLAGGDDYHINSVGYMDFAGSGIVHMCGGVAALVGALIVGPRTGRFVSDESFDPHSLPLVILGTFILWFGWYGFNCGSTLGMGTKAVATLAAQVAMNTTLAGATGGIVLLLLRFIIFRKYDLGGMCNGILAGLVSITAGCGNVECGTAVLIAALGACLYQGASSLLQRLHIDDPIDAFAVHGCCGAWGTLAAALFDWGKGVDYFNGWSGWECVGAPNCQSGAWGEAVAANITQIIVISLWTAGTSFLVFFPLRVLGVLRANDGVQESGADAAKHSPPKAYAM